MLLAHFGFSAGGKAPLFCATLKEAEQPLPLWQSGSVGQQQAGRRHPSAQEAGPRLQQQQHISPQVPQQQMTQQGMQRVMAQRQQHKSPAVASPSMNVFAGYIGMQAASQAPPAQPAQNMASR